MLGQSVLPIFVVVVIGLDELPPSIRIDPEIMHLLELLLMLTLGLRAGLVGLIGWLTNLRSRLVGVRVILMPRGLDDL